MERSDEKMRPLGGHKSGIRGTLQSPPSESVTPVHGYAKSSDGTRLFYSVEGKGAPLLFCYGLVCSSLHWTYQIEHFRKKYQAVWFDYRGHHRSDTPPDLGTLTIETFARDTLAVMDELKIEKAVILGHSMGVNVVLDFYRLFPDRVAGLVLANGTAKPPLETMFNMNTFQMGFKAFSEAYRLAPKLVEKMWRLQGSNPLSRALVTMGGFNPHLAAPEDVDLYVQQVSGMNPGVFIGLMNNYERYNGSSWLHEIKVPTLIVAGEHDRLTPLSQQKLMHQLIPGSQLEVIHHGSHCPQMDLPELVNMKIQRFLENIRYR